MSSIHRLSCTVRSTGRRGVWAAGIGFVILGLTPGFALAREPITVPNPQGSFLVRENLSIPGDPFPNSVFFNDDMDDPSYLGGDDLCGMDGPSDDDEVGEAHPFVTDTIRILRPGTYTFRVVNSFGVVDPFLALYSGNFDKANPDVGVLGCNDDITDNDDYSDLDDGDLFDDNGHDNYEYPALDFYWSLFEVELTPGTYTIMLATYDDYVDNTGWYADNGDALTGSIDEVGTTDASPTATATFEYWGPEGGIAGGVGASSSQADDAYLDHYKEILADSELPNTGASATMMNLGVGLGCLTLGSTLVMISRRRRLS